MLGIRKERGWRVMRADRTFLVLFTVLAVTANVNAIGQSQFVLEITGDTTKIDSMLSHSRKAVYGLVIKCHGPGSMPEARASWPIQDLFFLTCDSVTSNTMRHFLESASLPWLTELKLSFRDTALHVSQIPQLKRLYSLVLRPAMIPSTYTLDSSLAGACQLNLLVVLADTVIVHHSLLGKYRTRLDVWSRGESGEQSVFRTTSGEVLSYARRLQIADSNGVALSLDVFEHRADKLRQSFELTMPTSMEFETDEFTHIYDTTPVYADMYLIDLQMIAHYQPGSFRDVTTGAALSHLDFSGHLRVSGSAETGYYVGSAFAPPGWLSCRIHHMLERWMKHYAGN